MAKPSSNLPKGVRGPSGPGRAAVERRSLPFVIMLARMPKWIIVVLMAVQVVAS